MAKFEMKLLNELCEINIGKTPARAEQVYWGFGNFWLSIADIKSKYIDTTKETITDIAIEKCNMKIIPKNTVVMSFKLSLGKLAILKENMYSNEAIASFPILKSGTVLPEYLYYALKTVRLERYADKAAKGTTLNKKKLNQIKIPYTDIENQKKIVLIMNVAEDLVLKRQSQITALDELTQSLFLEMFGSKNQSELTEISEIAEVLGGLQVSGKRKDNPIEVPYLRVGNVYRNALVLDEIKFIRVTENELKRAILKKHDILVVEGHGNKKEIGRASRWNGEISNCVHQNHLIKVRVVNEHVRPEYLCSFINSIGGKIHMYKNSNTTSGLNTINTNVVRKMKVYIPPLTEQDKFIALEDEINKKRRKMSESLVQIKFLYNSLLQKAFKGELFLK
ncbi:restriction endonuclease subunit S [Paenibacillus pabuli]|uniref:restriction endonuclease subunit S n=1 Tax=Paenibacillus pabuli TaxID=1472 RepID=UPI003241DC4F